MPGDKNQMEEKTKLQSLAEQKLMEKSLDGYYKKKKLYEKDILKLLKLLQDASDKDLKEKLLAEIEAKQEAFEIEKSNHKQLHEDELKYIQEQKEAKKEKQKQLEAEALTEFKAGLGDQVTKAVTLLLDNLKNTFDTTMDKFIETQEAMAYNLNGTGASLHSVVRDLNSALAGSGIVKQEAVYTNLTKLVESGILLDVESRAYLSTVAEDLGMAFSNESKALNRLINLQRNDLSDNRMAIEASLKTFLNQNYQTSLYIKEGFEGVSNALIEALSLVSSSSAILLESTVLKWLGSLSSLGMSDSTITSLAEAIGQVGSGNISSLNGTAMQRLLVMGANQAGLDYGDLLMSGLEGLASNKLIEGIVSYIQNEIATADNNVVLSELARVFGLTVSDVVAASNLNIAGTLASVIGDDINELLNEMGNYVYLTTQLKNGLENTLYNWATNTASDELQYSIYTATNILGGFTSNILSAAGLDKWAAVAKYAPLLTSIVSLGETVVDSVKNIAGGTNSAAGIYSSLLGSKNLTTVSSGNDFYSSIGKSSSLSTIVSSNNNADLMEANKNTATKVSEEYLGEEAEEKSANDIYTLIKAGMNNDGTKFRSTDESVYTAIYNIQTTLGLIKEDIGNVKLSTSTSPAADTGGTVDTEKTTLNAGTNADIIEDSLLLTAVGVSGIYELLLAWYKGLASNGKTGTTMNVSNAINAYSKSYTSF